MVKNIYKQNTNSVLYDALVLEKFHEYVAELCDTNPNEVYAKLQELREVLLNGSISAHFICRVEDLDAKLFDPSKWMFLNEAGTNIAEPKIPAFLELVDDSSAGKQQVVAVGGSESSFIYQRAFLDFDWQDNAERALVPTMLLTQYLSQCEGPLWIAIRGDGLAYGANIYVRADRKMIELSLYRCAQPAEAYKNTSKIVEDLVNTGKIDVDQLEAAKRSLTFELTSQEGTVISAAQLAIAQQFRNLPKEYMRELCKRIWETGAEDVIKIGGPRVAKLFDPKVCFKNSLLGILPHPFIAFSYARF
ncbi:hypothetical protein WR25_04791 isoform B [Diploscapter pachys]|uniref:Peptidase M16 C-terminal domain-containing protein n=1 Tax=Diploscapter pachys TaxID=2018661 RepID=A0A2A2LC65_9BILA|nr:hypothetical protein WR25_04791 isoform B [Diploscapter pachys]